MILLGGLIALSMIGLAMYLIKAEEKLDKKHPVKKRRKRFFKRIRGKKVKL